MRFAVVSLLLLLPTAPAFPGALPLWEIRGGANRIDIVGSIHFLRPGRDVLPEPIVEAYERADVLLMELDLDDLDPALAQATVQRLGIDGQGRTLDVLLGERSYQDALARAKPLGIDLALLQPYEPWLAAITVSQMQLQQLGYDAGSGVEQQLLARARRDRKEIRGLETLEEQLSAMDELPAAAQRRFLIGTLEEAADMRERIDVMVDAWRNGDVDAMSREFLDGLGDQPELYRRIVVERNRNWARQIRALGSERRDFLVVVGTLHLVGPDSLIEMLGRSGQPARQRRN